MPDAKDWPVGRTIKEVRDITQKEMHAAGWDDRFHAAVVLVLDDGSKLYPSCDEEGNGPGAMFGVNPEGRQECLRDGALSAFVFHS